MSVYGPSPEAPKTFVLCFDGTGNKFSADSSDSNVLKIFRMLDRSQRNQYHYYQPGIGTYITSTDLSRTGVISRLQASYLKAKDSAIGSSFANHVLGGYKFLMRYYSPRDDIYFFGFSRGSYIARFLSEMLDFVGLLGAGNEELIQFAWNTFAKWQQRKGDTEEDRRKRREVFHYMKAFRETFSRPVKRIRFLGLFDTVNSVPHFESAWMQRSKFPYTARSSAKVIRHAVAIDERRAKFRQDLISEARPYNGTSYPRHRTLIRRCRDWRQRRREKKAAGTPNIVVSNGDSDEKNNGQKKEEPPSRGRVADDCRYHVPSHHRPHSAHSAHLAVPHLSKGARDDAMSLGGGPSQTSLHIPHLTQTPSVDSDDTPQSIDEVWFPGCHADIGGGWHLVPGEEWPLSHPPLVWMVQEARRAGLRFDETKLKQFECAEENVMEDSSFGLDTSYLGQSENLRPGESTTEDIAGMNVDSQATDTRPAQSASSLTFHSALELSSTKGHIHDCLQFDTGLSMISVLLWKGMEYLPFRRMDLQPDGSWKPIRWPLPCGEVRDIPETAHIHNSAIRRLEADKDYRPGNLILGGGGRGVKRAPDNAGIGKWVVAKNEGHPVRETFLRKRASKAASETNGKNEHNGEENKS